MLYNAIAEVNSDKEVYKEMCLTKRMGGEKQTEQTEEDVVIDSFIV